ncbi:MAG: dipeptidyl-peptidase-3, partial [Cyclobacteriaceae bacterium]
MISSFSVDKRFITRLLTVLASLAFLSACSEDSGTQTTMPAVSIDAATAPSPSLEATPFADDDFDYAADRFADIRMLRYQVPGFEDLNDQQ